ncbi:MAG: hypothetical protein JXB50_11235 [Spirochaetes bacterium]|nr:hypothetical protein [Spirochaetota bacterium]
MIKKINLILVISLFAIFFISAQTEKQKIAILKFRSINLDQTVAEVITETFTTLIADSKKYDIIERSQLDQIFSELKLISGDDFEVKTIIQIGKLAKAKMIIAGSVSKLGDKFIINARGIEIETGIVLFGKNIACDNENKLLEAVKSIASEITGVSSDIKVATSDSREVEFNFPEYVYLDNFEKIDTDVWINISKNDEIKLAAGKNGLRIFGKYREGRLSTYTSIESKPFKAASFAMEVSFMNPNFSSNYFSIRISNEHFLTGYGVSAFINFPKEIYKFDYHAGKQWNGNTDKVVDSFGDEDKVFHKLKIVYDMDNSTVFAYVDDKLIDMIRDFKYRRDEKVIISMTVGESRTKEIKDLDFIIKDFKSSIDLKK